MSTRDAPEAGARPNQLVPEPVLPPVTFIVRLSATADERMTGVVEHPGTGRKERFDGLDALATVIAALRLRVGGPQTSTGSSGLPAASTEGRAPPRPPP
jgi:hypothetical protein